MKTPQSKPFCCWGTSCEVRAWPQRLTYRVEVVLPVGEIDRRLLLVEVLGFEVVAQELSIQPALLPDDTHCDDVRVPAAHRVEEFESLLPDVDGSADPVGLVEVDRDDDTIELEDVDLSRSAGLGRGGAHLLGPAADLDVALLLEGTVEERREDVHAQELARRRIARCRGLARFGVLDIVRLAPAETTSARLHTGPTHLLSMTA